MRNYDLAKIAYAAYGKTTDFKNFRGEPMPAWDDLPKIIQDAWWEAAQAVKVDVETDHKNAPVYP